MSDFLEGTWVSTSEKFEFNKGESKNLVYRIKNVSIFPVRNITISAYTVDPDNDRTETNYISKINGEIPSLLMPDNHFDVEVELNIPDNYNKQYVIKKGDHIGLKVLCPVHIEVETEGHELVSSAYF